jgi:oxygen-independent coproporphyrinogen III oxidase
MLFSAGSPARLEDLRSEIYAMRCNTVFLTMNNNSSIYIHVPWCRRRCPYCDFYLVVGRPEGSFVDQLMAEWQARKAVWHRGVAQTLYFGGGTPSLLNTREIERLIGYFRAEGALSADAEITIEANPEDISQDYASDLFRVGVNRVSLGVQSFNDEILRTLGRKHTGDMAKKAIEYLNAAGFTNISIDLIIGVMAEQQDGLLDTLFYLAERGIPHISAYLLTIEEGTHFYKRVKLGAMIASSDDIQADVYGLVQKTLSGLGYQQYDISSYAKPGFLSRHNQVYWGQGGFIGLGPGAHSMRLLPDGGLERAHNQAPLAVWLKNPSDQITIATDGLDNTSALKESLAFGLRNMMAGINPSMLACRHQTCLPPGFLALVKKLTNYGWLVESQELIHITPSGALFADAIMREILGC